MDNKGKWALVTGASGGLGAAFAALLAEQGLNLVLAARNRDKLDALAAELRSRHGVDVVSHSVDMTLAGAAPELHRAIMTQGIALDILVNNAGQGLQGEFLERPIETTDRMLHLNILALTDLTHAVAADMAARGGGHILMVASMTAFMPAPTYAAYAASKSYVRMFGEALHAELRPKNVTVTVLSPGLMDTGFLSAAGQVPSQSMKRSMILPRLAAETGLQALFAGRQSVIAGRMNRLAALVSRLLPRGVQTRLMADALKS
ncbi:SDR family NAD(P)-dependent oxidoreductase [Luteimonas sp. BDR2-5]|uniref:SDR family NAD(P)-dependent oxidoreductase n=1 Tax=Proluteimonas luteida TaxID=2878685 RepID=UPI001E3AC35F|nr:SDR family NAD(P)-dependent oxidoreductase [Luteimonas sp. BDR2-5]MCD9026762.1 SDR family NAD(P)-dependent oxidoreductase [Luteimonas sp. BDR2-5]